MLVVADLIDPLTVTAEAATENAVVELSPAVLSKMPKAQLYNTFPMTPLAIVFLVIVAAAAGKFILGKN